MEASLLYASQSAVWTTQVLHAPHKYIELLVRYQIRNPSRIRIGYPSSRYAKRCFLTTYNLFQQTLACALIDPRWWAREVSMLRGRGGWSRRSAGGRGRATPSQWVMGGPGRAIPLQGGATRTGSFASDSPSHGAGNSLSAGASATAHGLQVGWSKVDHS